MRRFSRLPGDKVDTVEKFKNGSFVAMVSEEVNDVPTVLVGTIGVDRWHREERYERAAVLTLMRDNLN